MFFQNKRKIDSKVRFQNPKFRKELRVARSYKRTPRKWPQTNWEIILAKIGLGSWLSRFCTLLVLFLLIYLVFIPNPFFISHIKINGDNSNSINLTVKNFLDQKMPWPEKNLLLLSKNKLKNYLLQNNQKVLSVDKISKQLPSTLILNITPRVDRFAVQTSTTTIYSLSGDGVITGLLLDASGTLPSNLILIKLADEEDLTVGQSVLNLDKLNFINMLQGQLPSLIGTSADYYQLENLEIPDLTVYLKNGPKLLFNLQSDLSIGFNHLKLTLSQMSAADIKRLAYLDLRFQNKGYVCYKNTPCAQPISLPDNTGATSPASITN